MDFDVFLKDSCRDLCFFMFIYLIIYFTFINVYNILIYFNIYLYVIYLIIN